MRTINPYGTMDDAASPRKAGYDANRGATINIQGKPHLSPSWISLRFIQVTRFVLSGQVAHNKAS
jgi:hypothetical protein